MNVNDSEKMHHILIKKGLERGNNEEDSDIIILNSCAVREKAQEKIFSFTDKDEQTKIVKYIKSEIVRIDFKVEKTNKLIKLFKEYKMVLISEVVTGKIKVV